MRERGPRVTQRNMPFSTSSLPSPPLPGACVMQRQGKRAGSDASDSRSGSDHGGGHGSSNNNAKRIKVVTQACKDCRRNKAKCDGTRPKCGPCIQKGRACGYEGEVGQSRQAAMKARLETLEKLFDTLQTRPHEDAERLLQSIRERDGLASAMRCLESGAAAAHAERAMSGCRSDQSSSSPYDSPYSGRARAMDYQHRTHDSRRQSLAGLCSGLSTVSSASSVTAVSRDDKDKHVLFVRLELPDQAVTRRAIDSFYDCTGELFHVFSREVLVAYADDVYRPRAREGEVSPSLKKAACCVAAIAAIGVQYRSDDFEADIHTTYYDLCRHYFVDVLEDRPLDSIRVCTLLAMFNIMNKATAAVGYVEVGLGMSKRHSLSHGQCTMPGLTATESREYRNTWRCLIFFSTWLSSTLGYISNEEIPFDTLLPVAEAESGSSADVVDRVQIEMTRISMLKADILRMHLAFKDLTDLALESIMADLQEWYHRLPPSMSLATLGESTLPDAVRRSIYYVHLLYLGAIMLLYRRVASQFNRTKVADDKRGKRFEQLMLNHAEEGVLAAKTSSRVLNLLLGQVGCFKRCWVIIFQSYTSCLVLLHCVAQKQVHNFPKSSWEEELLQAKTCLDSLEYCSTLDPVALKFYERLLPIHDTLARHAPSLPSLSSTSTTSSSMSPPPPTTVSQRHSHRSSTDYDPIRAPHPSEYLLTIPENGNPHSVAIATFLLRTLSRPYDNPSDGQNASEGYGLDCGKRRGMGPDSVAMQWESKYVSEYKWDPKTLAIPDGVLGQVGRDIVDGGMFTGGRWLGSETPSGWSVDL